MGSKGGGAAPCQSATFNVASAGLDTVEWLKAALPKAFANAAFSGQAVGGRGIVLGGILSTLLGRYRS